MNTNGNTCLTGQGNAQWTQSQLNLASPKGANIDRGQEGHWAGVIRRAQVGRELLVALSVEQVLAATQSVDEARIAASHMYRKQNS